MIQYPKLVILSTLFLIIGIFIGGGSILWEERFSLKDSTTRAPVLDSLVSELQETKEGVVTQISTNSIVIERDGKRFEAQINKETEVHKNIISQKTGETIKEMAELGIQDIKEGDNAAVSIIADADGNLISTRVSIVELQ